MSDYLSKPCTAFSGTRRIASGSLIDVALAIKAAQASMTDPILSFDDASGAVIDLDLRGTTAQIVARLTLQGELEAPHVRTQVARTGGPARSRGRPKLGVVAREVTLLPRHWEWLAKHPGGASQALRRLIDEARHRDGGQADRKARHERCYRFLSALAGDLPDYEEVIRALFADDSEAFADRMAKWPQDVRDHVLSLARLGPNMDRS